MRVFAALFLTTILVFGCSKDESSSTSITSTETAPPPAAVPAPVPYDLLFLDTMSKHHQGAVDMAEAAKGRITNRQLKAMVEKMPAAQQREIDQMKSWRDQWYPGAAPAENMSMPGMDASMNMDMSPMMTMQAGTGYDVMFIDMMIPHHQGAVTMSQDALAKAEHPELRTLAQTIIDEQQKEIDQLNRWKAAWRR